MNSAVTYRYETPSLASGSLFSAPREAFQQREQGGTSAGFVTWESKPPACARLTSLGWPWVECS